MHPRSKKALKQFWLFLLSIILFWSGFGICVLLLEYQFPREVILTLFFGVCLVSCWCMILVFRKAPTPDQSRNIKSLESKT